MKILLDENIPVQLKDLFDRHHVASVNDSDVGWKSIKNGRLLVEMEGRFDLLIEYVRFVEDLKIAAKVLNKLSHAA